MQNLSDKSSNASQEMVVNEKDRTDGPSDSEVIVPVHNDHYNGHEIFKINCCIFRHPMLKNDYSSPMSLACHKKSYLICVEFSNF